MCFDSLPRLEDDRCPRKGGMAKDAWTRGLLIGGVQAQVHECAKGMEGYMFRCESLKYYAFSHLSSRSDSTRRNLKI